MKAFTLVELMVVITIIAIMTSIAVFGLSSVRQKAQDTSHLSGIRDLQLSLEAYKSVNGTYPEAGTQGSTAYITGLSPTFMSKLPYDNGQSASTGYGYAVTSDKKSYCVYVRGNIFKPESQTDLYDAACSKTWKACRGSNTSSLPAC